MNVLLSLSLWLTLMMSSCCGDAGGREEETTTSDYYDDYPSATPDYDYTATFDYYYVTGPYPSEVRNQSEEETTTSDFHDNDYPSKTPDDYGTGPYPTEVHNQASGIGRVSPLLLLGLAVHQIWNW